MYREKKVAVIIPALNEEESLPLLLGDMPEYVDNVYVTDNGSTDNTARIAREKGAVVTTEKKKGYGMACLRAISCLQDEDIVVFLDGDYSDDPSNMDLLLDPIIASEADMVISNRFTLAMEKGSMSLPQRFGNKLSVFLIGLLWGFKYYDLGPFRAVSRESLESLEMEDKNFGWTIEMQIKAIQHGLRIVQVDVPYKNREKGKSKVSSTVSGVIRAGYKIIYTIFKLKLSEILYNK